MGGENYFLETRARSRRSDVDPTDGHEVLWGPSVGPVPITVRYHVRFSTTLFPAVAIMASSSVRIRTARGHSQASYVSHFTSQAGTASIVDMH